MFGVWGTPDAARIVALGIYALQHRGQESAGIVSTDGTRLYSHRGLGLVTDIFRQESLFANLPGQGAIGHVRYSTTGSSVLANAQPILANYGPGSFAVAHNGNLTNTNRLRQAVQRHGAIFQTTTDSELILHLMASAMELGFEDAAIKALGQVEGAWSLLLMNERQLIAARDPRGFRPLCLGKLGEAWVVASETCALDVVGAQFLRHIHPGEMAVIDSTGVRLEEPFPRPSQSFCVFEYIYFSRPDSLAENMKSIYDIRVRLGEELARTHPAPGADVVMSVPDSSNAAALGFSRASGLPLEFGLMRSHYIGRTFIAPEQSIRSRGVRLKFNALPATLKDKSIVLVDDSIVRGTTSRQIIQLLRSVGVGEIHLRITAAPWRHPCYYGIDTPTKDELVANRMDETALRDWLGADSVGFIDVDTLMRIVPPTQSYCTACFTGNYPVPPEDEANACAGRQA